MKYIILVLIGLFINTYSFSQDSLAKREFKKIPLWVALTPAASHFYEGRIGTGVFLSGLTVGATTAGIIYNKELKSYSNSPYYNYPLFLGMNAYGVDKCDLGRTTLMNIKTIVPDFKFDELTFKQLMYAPFKPKNFISPITGIMLAVAAGELWFYSRNPEFRYNDVDKIHVLNGFRPRDKAMIAMGATSLGMSWEAGVAEEYIFRNYMMPMYDYRMGQRKGLILSSAVFGGMHALNYLFVSQPNPLTILYHVTFASTFGYILGKSVQLNDYKIGRAIAAHTWYDFSLMLGSFIMNPKENVFGVSMKLKM